MAHLPEVILLISPFSEITPTVEMANLPMNLMVVSYHTIDMIEMNEKERHVLPKFAPLTMLMEL